MLLVTGMKWDDMAEHETQETHELYTNVVYIYNQCLHAYVVMLT